MSEKFTFEIIIPLSSFTPMNITVAASFREVYYSYLKPFRVKLRTAHFIYKLYFVEKCIGLLWINK